MESIEIGHLSLPKLTGGITKLDLCYDTVFSNYKDEPILKLCSDGKIIVNGDHDEAVKTFLKALEHVYCTLPGKLELANREIKRLEGIIETLERKICP